MTTDFLLEDLEADEGWRKFPYLDSRGFWTIGVGHNISADPPLLAQLPALKRNGLVDAQVKALLGADVAKVEARLDADLPWWRGLDAVRQDAMVNLAFNLGEGKFATWRHTLADIQGGDFKAAELDLVSDEPWASQVHDRAKRLAYQMETGLRAWAVSEAEIEAVLAGRAPPPAPPPAAAQPSLPPQGEVESPAGDRLGEAPTASQPPPIPALWKLIAHHLATAGAFAMSVLAAVGAFAQAHPLAFVFLIATAALFGAVFCWLASLFAHQHRDQVAKALAAPSPAQASLAAQLAPAISAAVNAAIAAALNPAGAGP